MTDRADLYRQAVDLRKEGRLIRECAEILDMNESALAVWLRNGGPPKPKPRHSELPWEKKRRTLQRERFDEDLASGSLTLGHLDSLSDSDRARLRPPPRDMAA